MGSIRDLAAFDQIEGGTRLSIDFAPTQSFFVVFRRPAAPARNDYQNFRELSSFVEVDGSWNLHFDPVWGGPPAVVFDELVDWTTRGEEGIKYYSGTAIYRKNLRIGHIPEGRRIYLDLGTVKHLAEVTINGKNLGVVWTAPWRVDATDALQAGENLLEIACTNVWANRLIGDEQQPPDVVWQMGDPQMKGGWFLQEFPDWFLNKNKRPSQGRYTFTTWNYFTKDSMLEPSGLLGPIKLLIETQL